MARDAQLKDSGPSYGDYIQSYGRLTDFNIHRVIMDAVGKDILAEIAEDLVHALNTSAAVYEENGDYAAGIMASGWCRLLDQASFDLCGVKDPKQAMKSGKWLCHESCWTNASRVAIDKKESVDVQCSGKIRIYAVPIIVGEHAIGSVNVGHGEPPTNASDLLEISKKYNIPYSQVISASNESMVKSTFLVDIAKRRVEWAARLISALVQRNKTEKELFESKQLLSALNEAQKSFIRGMDRGSLFHRLLEILLELTQSQYGYIGETRIDSNGERYQLSRAISNISWSPETIKYYKENWRDGLRFSDLDNLTGNVIKTGEIVQCNDPSKDPRSRGLPKGHPKVDNFLGLPLKSGDKLIGTVGVANRPGGYNSELISFLGPYLDTCSGILSGYIAQRDRDKAHVDLKEKNEFQDKLFGIMAEGVLFVDDKYMIRAINDSALNILGLTSGDVETDNILDINLQTIREDGSVYPKEEHPSIVTMRTGQPFSKISMGIVSNSGDVKWISINTRPIIPLSTNKPSGVVTSFSDITAQKQEKENREKALKEKTVLLQEIHHRVKNNLALINSLLSLKSGYVEDEYLKRAFDDVQSRIRSMALAHELLYKTQDLSHICMENYIDLLTDHLVTGQANLGGASVDLKKNIDDISLSLKSAIPMGFIITELVSNCLKHAFPPGVQGQAIVEIRKSGDSECEIMVSDNGVGIPESVDILNPQSLGLDLVSTFVEQLQGRMDVQRDNGTKIIIKDLRL